MAWQSEYFQPAPFGYPGNASVGDSMKQVFQLRTYTDKQFYNTGSGQPFASSGAVLWSASISERQQYMALPGVLPQPASSQQYSAVHNQGALPAPVPHSMINPTGCFTPTTQPTRGQPHMPYQLGALQPGFLGLPIPNSVQHGGATQAFPIRQELVEAHTHQGFSQGQAYHQHPQAAATNIDMNVSHLHYPSPYSSACSFVGAKTSDATHQMYSKSYVLYQGHSQQSVSYGTAQSISVRVSSLREKATAADAVLSSTPQTTNDLPKNRYSTACVGSPGSTDRQLAIVKGHTSSGLECSKLRNSPAVKDVRCRSTLTRSHKTDEKVKTVSRKSKKKNLLPRLHSSGLAGSDSVETLQTRIERLLPIDRGGSVFSTALLNLSGNIESDSSMHLLNTSAQNACKCARNPISCELHNPLRSPVKQTGNGCVPTFSGSQSHTSPAVLESVDKAATENGSAWKLMETDVDIMTRMYCERAEQTLDSDMRAQQNEISHLQPSGVNQACPQTQSVVQRQDSKCADSQSPHCQSLFTSGFLSSIHCSQEASSPSSEMRNTSDDPMEPENEVDIFDTTCMVCSKVFSSRDELSDHLFVHMDDKEECPSDKDVKKADVPKQEPPGEWVHEPRDGPLSSWCATSLQLVDKQVPSEVEPAPGGTDQRSCAPEACSVDLCVSSPNDLDGNSKASTYRAQRSLLSTGIGEKYTVTTQADPKSHTTESLLYADELTQQPSEGNLDLVLVDSRVCEGKKVDNSTISSCSHQDTSPQNIQPSEKNSVSFCSETHSFNSDGVLKYSTKSLSLKPKPASDLPRLKPGNTAQNTNSKWSVRKTGHQSEKGDSGELSSISETSVMPAQSFHHEDTSVKKSEQQDRRKHVDLWKDALTKANSAGFIALDSKTAQPPHMGWVKLTKISEKPEQQKCIKANQSSVGKKMKNSDLPDQGKRSRKHLDSTANGRYENKRGLSNGSLVNQDIGNCGNSPSSHTQQDGVGKVHAEKQKYVTEQLYCKSLQNVQRKSGSQESISCRTDGPAGWTSDMGWKPSQAAAAAEKPTPRTSQAFCQQDRYTGEVEGDNGEKLSARKTFAHSSINQGSSETDGSYTTCRSGEKCAGNSDNQKMHMADMPDSEDLPEIMPLKKWIKKSIMANMPDSSQLPHISPLNKLNENSQMADLSDSDDLPQITPLKKWNKNRHRYWSGASPEKDRSNHYRSTKSICSPKAMCSSSPVSRKKYFPSPFSPHKKLCYSLNLAHCGSKMNSEMTGRIMHAKSRLFSPNSPRSRLGGHLTAKTVKAQRIVDGLRNIFQKHSVSSKNASIVENKNLHQKDVPDGNFASTQKSESDFCGKVTINGSSDIEPRRNVCLANIDEHYGPDHAYPHEENLTDSENDCARTRVFRRRECRDSPGVPGHHITSSGRRQSESDYSDQSSEGKMCTVGCGEQLSEGKTCAIDGGRQSSTLRSCSDKSLEGKKEITDCTVEQSNLIMECSGHTDYLQSMNGKKLGTNCDPSSVGSKLDCWKSAEGRKDLHRPITFCVKCDTVFTNKSAYDRHWCCQVGSETSDMEEGSAEEHMDVTEKRANGAWNSGDSCNRHRVCKDRVQKAVIQLDSTSDSSDNESVIQNDWPAVKFTKVSKGLKHEKGKHFVRIQQKAAGQEKRLKLRNCREKSKHGASCVQTLFRCDYCEQGFLSRGGLLFHWQTVHRKV